MDIRWDYLIFEMSGDGKVVRASCECNITLSALFRLGVDEALHIAGKLRWELVSVTPENFVDGICRKYYLKRPAN